MNNDNIIEEQQESSTKKRVGKWIPFYLAIAFLLGMAVAIYVIPSTNNRLKSSNKQLSKFSEVLQYVNHYYIDTLDQEQLIENAINGMLQSLDPHSTYADAVENKAMQESLDGSFEGIGVQFNIMNDTVMVVAVISGGPSEKAGLRPGDRIVTVDEENFAGVGIQNDDVMRRLRGKRNSVVKVGVMRQGFDQVYEYDIVRDVIPTYTVDASYMMDDKTGYVRINQFGSTTGREFSTALQKLKKEGMAKLILDLRGNPGGYLEAAISVCDELLPAGELIVYTEGLRVKTDMIKASSYGNFKTGEVVLLIDDFSASASEIVAGAIQDNDRGWIVGRRSFGKGLVQRQFDLKDGSTIRLTTSRYHTPSGRSIQKNYETGKNDYTEELLKRYENGEMDSASNIKFDKTQEYYTKKGRIVYGGGGIMPDYFVPLDRDSNMVAFYQVLNSSALTEFSFNYATTNTDQLKKQYPDVKSFIKNMKVDETLFGQLMNFYYAKNKEAKILLNKASEKELKLWLKALIGRNLYQEEAFYPIINSSDKVILKAIEL